MTCSGVSFVSATRIFILSRNVTPTQQEYRLCNSRKLFSVIAFDRVRQLL